MVCCYSCGVGMKDWMSEDDIWSRHARQSPHCQLLIREMGEQYISSQINELGRYVYPLERQRLKVSKCTYSIY